MKERGPDYQKMTLRTKAATNPTPITNEQWGRLHDWDCYIGDLKPQPRNWLEHWKKLEKKDIERRNNARRT